MTDNAGELHAGGYGVAVAWAIRSMYLASTAARILRGLIPCALVATIILALGAAGSAQSSRGHDTLIFGAGPDAQTRRLYARKWTARAADAANATGQ